MEAPADDTIAADVSGLSVSGGGGPTEDKNRAPEAPQPATPVGATVSTTATPTVEQPEVPAVGPATTFPENMTVPELRSLLQSLPESKEGALSERRDVDEQLAKFPALVERLRDGYSPKTHGAIPPARTIMRFFASQEFDVVKTADMLLADLEWRKAFLSKLDKSTLDTHERHGKYYWHGHDRQGRKCLVVQVRRFNVVDYSIEELANHFVWMVDRGVAECKPPDDRIVVLFDVKDESRKQFSLSFNKAVLDLLVSHYPNLLGACHIINTGKLTRVFIKIFLPFMPRITREKVHVHSGMGNVPDTYFDKSELLVRHGGTSRFDLDRFPTLQ